MSLKLLFTVLASFALGTASYFYTISKNPGSQTEERAEAKGQEVDPAKAHPTSSREDESSSASQRPGEGEETRDRLPSMPLREEQILAKKKIEEALQMELPLAVRQLRIARKRYLKTPIPGVDANHYQDWGEKILSYGDLAQYYLNFKECHLKFASQKQFSDRENLEATLIEALKLDQSKVVAKLSWCEAYLGDCEPFFIKYLPHTLSQHLEGPFRFEFKNSTGFVMSRNLGTVLYHFQVDKNQGKWIWKNTQVCPKDKASQFPRFSADL